MNEAIFAVFIIAAIINSFSWVAGLLEWVWFSVIMQEKSPEFFWKWQFLKYGWVDDSCYKEPTTILIDILVLLGGAVVFGFLGSVGLLAPLVIITALVLGARWYVADNKAKADKAS